MPHADLDWIWEPLQEQDLCEREYYADWIRYAEENESHRRGLSSDSSDCSCQIVEEAYARQALGAVMQEWVTGTDWIDVAVQEFAVHRGWKTLYGPHGRRKRVVEQLPEPPERRGAPRACFAGERMIRRAAEFIDHGREAGPAHVRQSLDGHMLPTAEEEMVEWRVGAEVSGLEQIHEFVETASELTVGRYEYRRQRLADRTIAAVAGCGVRTVRNLRINDRAPLDEQYAELAWVERVGNRVYEARTESEHDRRRERAVREAFELYFSGSAQEMKRWLARELDVTQGELMEQYVRPEGGIEEDRALRRYFQNSILPHL